MAEADLHDERQDGEDQEEEEVAQRREGDAVRREEQHGEQRLVHELEAERVDEVAEERVLGAEKQVCIGAWDTAVQQKAALAKDMFDASQLIAEKTLREDIFPRFEENEKGKALARDRPELCSAGGI